MLEPRRCPTANNDTALCRNKKELYNTIVVTRTTLAPSFIHTIVVESCCRCMCVSVSLSLSHITPGFHKLVFNQFQPKTVLLQHDTLVLEMIVLKCTYEKLMMCTPLCAGRFWHETRSFLLEWTIRIFPYQIA